MGKVQIPQDAYWAIRNTFGVDPEFFPFTSPRSQAVAEWLRDSVEPIEPEWEPSQAELAEYTKLRYPNLHEGPGDETDRDDLIAAHKVLCADG